MMQPIREWSPCGDSLVNEQLREHRADGTSDLIGYTMRGELGWSVVVMTRPRPQHVNGFLEQQEAKDAISQIYDRYDGRTPVFTEEGTNEQGKH